MTVEIDRLSRGLMREEIRNWLRDAGEFPEGRLIQLITQRVKAFNRKPITDAQAKFLRRELLDLAKNTLLGFEFSSSRQQLIDTTFITGVDSFYHWRPLDYLVVDPQSEESDDYQIRAFELRCADIAIDRKRVIYDDYPANLIISEHVLYRLLERGAVASHPLQYIKDTFQHWYPLSILLLAYHAKFGLKKNQGFLPVPGGAFLFKVVSTPFEGGPENLVYYSRRRLFFSRPKRYIDQIPFESPFDLEEQGQKEYFSIQLATYINSEVFRPAQDAIYDRLLAFSRKYSSDIKLYPSLVNRKVIKKDLVNKEAIKRLHSDLHDIVASPEWTNACGSNGKSV